MSDNTHERPTGESAPGQQNPYGSQNPYGAQSPYGSQNPYAPYTGSPTQSTGAGQSDPYAQDPYAQNAYGQNPYGQPAGNQNPYAQTSYPQNPYDTQNPYGQDPYAQDPYAQGYGQPGYGQPYSSTYGQQPYGAMTGYAGPMGPMRPAMGFGQAFKAYFQNYARFNGRASRSEYWWTELANVIIVTVLYVFIFIGADSNGGNGNSTISAIAVIALLGWFLASLVPSLALTTRRLHDTNRSGWMQLLGLIPFVGGIVVIVLLCGESNPAGARFDADTQPALGE